MSQIKNDNSLTRAPKPIDERVGFWLNGKWRNFASVAAALADPDVIKYRYPSMTIPIYDGVNPTVEWWFDGGDTDSDFKVKTPDLSGLVPYTGATGDVTLGNHNITAGSFIKTGGTASQFLKADGSVDSTVYAPQSALSGYQLLTQKDQANGYPGLDSGGKILVSQLPDAVFGQLKFGGTYDGVTIVASSNFPELNGQPLPASSSYEGVYFISTASYTNGGINYITGDWIVSVGTSWTKVDNTDAVSTVFGRTGAILANESDYSTFYPLLSAAYDNPSWITSLAYSKLTGVPDFSGWSLTGNSGTVDGTNFIGTTDNVPLNFKINNQKAGRIDASLGNTFFGYQSGNVITTGDFNTAFGENSLSGNTQGASNTAIGSSTLSSNTTGNNNIAIGSGALFFSETTDNNVAIGGAALNNNQGSNNTALGTDALLVNTTGSNNVAIGYKADVSTGNLTNATAIGTNAIVNASNKVQIGDTSVTTLGVGTTTFTGTSGTAKTFALPSALTGTLALTSDIPSLSGYELLANKQNSLAVDGTGVKYPTVDAINDVISYATPQQYGAIGDGISDDTNAINDCLLNNDNVRFFGVYKITDSLIIRPNQFVYSDDSIINFTTTTESALIADNADGFRISGKMLINGSGIADNTAIGLEVINSSSYSVSGVTVSDISGIGILITPQAIKPYESAGGNFIDCTIRFCHKGFSTLNTGGNTNGAEYITVTNINAYSNYTAVDINTGNISVIGGSIKYNGNGIIIGTGGNDSHGIISSVNINHNTINNVWCNGAQFGETFVGCHLYGDSTAGIRIEDSQSMLFIGCIIDGIITVNNIGSHFIKSSMLDVDFVVNNPSGNLKITDCFTRYGESYSGNLLFLTENGSLRYLNDISLDATGKTIIDRDYADDRYLGILNNAVSATKWGNSEANFDTFGTGTVGYLIGYDSGGTDMIKPFQAGAIRTFLDAAKLTANNTFVGDQIITGRLTVSVAPTDPTDVVRLTDLPTIASGTYTPTVTGVSNVTGTPTPQIHHYTRVGNQVTVYGFCLITPTAVANTEATITLPIATTSLTTYDLVGHGSSSAPGDTVARVYGTTAGTTATINFNPTSGGSGFNFMYSFMYTIN